MTNYSYWLPQANKAMVDPEIKSLAYEFRFAVAKHINGLDILVRDVSSRDITIELTDGYHHIGTQVSIIELQHVPSTIDFAGYVARYLLDTFVTYKYWRK